MIRSWLGEASFVKKAKLFYLTTDLIERGEKMIRFIHAADLHLDSPFKGLKKMHPSLFDAIHQSTFASFKKIVTTAIEKKTDFVLLCGDIYDGENQSVKAQSFFREQMKRLQAAHIPVYLLHGNHDFMGRDSLRIQMPDNVSIFKTEVETQLLTTASQERVAISGFSYPSRWVKERMIDHYPSRKRAVDYHIGMLHGFFEGSASKEDVYAPFSMADLLERSYDYWALGHIHKREVLNQQPIVAYSGNTQGRNPNESGDKGVYLVELEKGSEPTMTFIETAPIVWKEQQLSLKGLSSLQSVYAEIEGCLERASEAKKTVLLSIRFDDYDGLSKDLLERIKEGDLLEGFNQQQSDKGIYLYHLSLNPLKEQFLFRYDEAMQASFEKSGHAFREKDYLQTILQDLFKHPSMRGRFSELEQDEELAETIIQSARNLLFEDIAFEEGDETS